jgi:pilus assembly protein Flp/PilA
VNFQLVAAYIAARFRTTERGSALVEYALLLALIATVCILALTTLGTGLKDRFSSISDSIN